MSAWPPRNTYLFLTEVLPRAIKKYGGIDGESLRKAALDVDLPEGGTMLGFGVKFERRGGGTWPARTSAPSRSSSSTSTTRPYVVWPKSQQQARAGAAAAGRHDLQLQVGWSGNSVRRAMLVVEGLVKRFGGFTAVSNVSFKVDQGEILGLIGPNGSGKSTIFNMLSGTFPPSAGSIKFEGHELAGLAPHKIINRGIGRTFQIPRPFRRLTIFENVALAGYFGQGRHSRAKADEAAETRARHGRPADRPAVRRSMVWAPPG